MMISLPSHKAGWSRLAVILLVALTAIGGFSSVVEGKGINSKAGTTGFSFLKLGVGAKAIAMGGAFSAVADDPTVIYYNPAGTVNLSGKQFLAGYHNYVLDMQSGFVAGTLPLMDKHRLGFFVDYLNYGNFTETEADGQPTGNDFSGGDFLIGANFSTYILPEFSAGINVKFMSEYAAGYSAEAMAVDLGLLYKFKDGRTSAALSVNNLGVVLSGFSGGDHKDDLPLSFRAGVAHNLRELPLIVALEGVLPNDNDPYLNVGLEMSALQPLYLRLGYSTFGQNYQTNSNSDALGGLSFGFGVDYRKYQISYAFMPYLDLGSSHRVTILGGF